MDKYGRISLYDIDFEKTYIIHYQDIHFAKGDGYNSIRNPDNTYGTSTDHESFPFRDDLFDSDRVQDSHEEQEF